MESLIAMLLLMILRMSWPVVDSNPRSAAVDSRAGVDGGRVVRGLQRKQGGSRYGNVKHWTSFSHWYCNLER